MTDITMPKLSDSMEEGTILKWLIPDGQPVARGDDLVEIETDKATMAYVSEEAGTLQIRAPEGTTLPVGAVIAQIAVGAASVDATTPEVVVGAPTTTETAGPHSANGTGGDPAASVPAPVVEMPALTEALAPLSGAARVALSPATGPPRPATPLARRAARIHQVDLSALRGTGPGGRITRGDVLASAGVREPAPPPRLVSVVPGAPADTAAQVPERPAAPVAGALGRGAEPEIQAPTRLQQVIARRMVQARATIPEFEVQTEVSMDDAIALRARLKELGDEEFAAPSINDFIIRSCALALRRHPRVNASFENQQVYLHNRINVGFAVARDDALIVPTVYDADQKALAALARETRQLADRVRSGALTPPELAGGTFTVSNLGMYGMTAIRPVINPPQAAILGVGSIRETLARIDGEIVERTLMTITLSADHRILYGADAASFLAAVRTLLESPLRLLV